MKQAITPRADQPRFAKKDLTKGEPSLQYRVQGAKSYGNRMDKKSDSRQMRSN
jgi:hypothetical protein